jgi:hypothetical protein
LDITSCKEVDFYKAEYGIIRNDFWQKFMNRKAIEVDLGATVDMDGNAATSYAANTLTLPSQKFRETYQRKLVYDTPSSATETLGVLTVYLMWETALVEFDEISERFDYPTQITSTIPTSSEFFYFRVQYAGTYTYSVNPQARITLSAARTVDLRFFCAVVRGGTIVSGPTQIGSTDTAGGGSVLTFDYAGGGASSIPLTLDAGDEVYFYGTLVTGGPAVTITYEPDYSPYTAVQLIGDSTFPDTTAESYTIIRAAKAIVSKLVGVDPAVTSGYIDSGDCGGFYHITRGYNIRGYTSSGGTKFYLSFDKWWNGLNPILNLGLGYVNGADQIEIEPKSEFYDPVPVINFDYVNNIERSYGSDYIFKSIEIGFSKWAAESSSGVKDIQAKSIFRTRFKTAGKDIKLLSSFVAASSAIEQTRRNRVEQNRDWRMDEDVFIISVDHSATTTAEQSLPGTSSGPTNYTTMYNLRISPARNIRRWHDYLNGCLKWYTTNDDLVFSGGEGFKDTGTTITSASGDCEGNDVFVFESSDIDAGSGHDFLFVPVVYSFEYPLTWAEYKAMRDNRKKAIGVSRTNSDHVACFILNLEYEVTRGKAKFTVMLGQETPL